MVYIENTCLDPRYNLALEEYVFYNLKFDEPVLLLWQNSPSVIIGRYQNTIEEINYDFVEENKISVVRRNTGGGAVYHDLGNLNYSLIVPAVESGIDFKTFTIPLIKALRSYGIHAEQSGRNDILVDGCKFSGNAQQLYKEKLLHHGTIMFDVNVGQMVKALRVKPGKIESKGIKSVRSRVINLSSYFPKDMDIYEFKQLLLAFFNREYGVWQYDLSDKEQFEVKQLKDQKYSSWDWNYGKSPKSNVMRSGYFKCGYIEFHFQIENHVIQSMELVGDFFSSSDIDEFTTLFNGVGFNKKSLSELLQGIELKKYFGNISVDEIIETII